MAISGQPTCMEILCAMLGKDMPQRMQMLDMFAGMGGFSYALREQFKTVLYCEIDKTCQKVLQCLMRNNQLERAPIHSDIKSLHFNTTKPTLLTAGSPCTDVTILSKSAVGIHGSRSKLVFEIFRLLDECPNITAVFLENSPMIVRRGGEEIVGNLESRGFSTAWGIFSAREVGAPHFRRRWYCLAVKKDRKLRSLEKMIPHEWSTEPVPRIIPKNVAASRELMARAGVLGNGVVPQCVMYAFNSLNAALNGLLPRWQGKRAADIIFLNTGEAVSKLSQNVSRPKIALLINYEDMSFAHKAWATPVCNVYASICETQRAARMLATQILHDVETLNYAEQITGRTHNTREMNTLFAVNPAFIEWLMGYPFNWTICAHAM